MFESSPDCVKLLELDGRIVDMNLNGRCAMQVDDITSLRGREWRTLWPEESRVQLDAALAAARSGQLGRFDAFCPTMRGTPKWWDVTVTAVRQNGDQIEHLLVVSRDITLLHASEQEQRESVARLQFILEASRVGEWSLDLDTGKASTSLLHDRCYGYNEPVADWTMDSFMRHVHPSDRQRVEDSFREAIANQGEWRFECRVIWPDESVHWVSVLGNIYNSQGEHPGRMVGTVVDITRQKRAEILAQGQKAALELAMSDAPLLSVLDVLTRAAEEGVGETVVASVMLMDEDGRRLRNGSAPSIPDAYLHAIDGLEIGPAVGSCGTAAFLKQTVVVSDIQTDPLWADFREVALASGLRSCWSQPILSSRDEVLGTLAVYRSVPTTPTQAEREAMGLLLSTASLVIDRHRQVMERQQAESGLRHLAEELRASDQRKTEFLATLAHELRNPLAPIINGLEVLKWSAGDAVAMASTREMMERQASHMTHLIDDLLDVARITSGKLELRKERVALQDIIVTALDTSMALIEARSHRLSLDMPESPVWLMADPTRIAQVISNLLNNSAKYTPKGGHIQLTVTQSGTAVDISVTDDGLGLAESSLATVFELFTQVRPNGKSLQDGLGVGLTLVKRLAELHDGAVSVSSAGPGLGSSFRVSLPLPHINEDTSASAQIVPQTSPELPAGRALRILVVDDNVDAAEVLMALLEMNEHQVWAAHDGHLAIELAEQVRPDVIFLDIGMPGMSGLEVARVLRTKRHLTHIVLIALTGWGSESDRAKSKDAGFDYHLTKPTKFDEIEDLLASLTPPSDDDSQRHSA